MKRMKVIAVLMTVCLVTGLADAGPVFGAELLADEHELICTEEESLIEEESPAAEVPESDEEAIELTEDTKGPAGDESDEINALIKEKDIMGVLYLCDSFPLRSSSLDDSEITVTLECGSTLYLKEAVYTEAGYRFLVSAFKESEEVYGYIPMDKFICVDEDYLEWEEGLEKNSTGFGPDKGPSSSLSERAVKSVYTFPDSYREKLFNVLNAHPDWVFVPQKVGMSLDEALNAELSDRNRNLIYKTADSSYKDGSYDSNWYYVSKTGLAYYMNPANFVGSEQNIFMFEQLTYNSSYHTASGVQSVLKGTFMSGAIPGEGMTYADAFYGIGSSLKVSPYHLAARVYQEQGKGTSPLISGTYKNYEGYYNYFNIKASGKTNAQIYENGLTYAKSQGWNSRYKSLSGGAAFDSKNYILAGQDTPYLEKYNVVKKTYWHQYMQNVSAPLTESSKVYSMYKNSGALNNPFVFKIPVYDGDTISPDPRTKPTFKIKSDRSANLYYTMGTDEACAEYTVTATEGIKSIRLTEESKEAIQASGKPYYDVLSYDGETGKLILTPRELDENNYNKINKKVTLELDFEKYGRMTSSFNVATVNRAPTINCEQAIIYGGIDRTFIALKHSGLPEDISVTCTDEKLAVAINKDRTGIDVTVSAFEGLRGGNRKLIFTSDAFRAPINRNVSIRLISDPASAFSFGVSGRINLTDRAGTYIIYTPNMNNFKGLAIDNAELTGEESGLFDLGILKTGDLLPTGKTANGPGGAFVLTAKEGAVLATNKTYKVNIRSFISNGLVIDKTVSVRPSQSVKRTTLTPGTVNLSEGMGAEEFTIKTAGTSPGDSAIESVTLTDDRNSALFDFAWDKEGTDPHLVTGYVSFKDDIPKKGRYRIAFSVIYKGHAENVKPSTLYLTVNVK